MPGMVPTPPRRGRATARVVEADVAAGDLRAIRETLDRAGTFTAVSGAAQTIVGTVGVAAALVAHRQNTASRWMAVWLTAATVGILIALAGIVRKARRLHVSLAAAPARRFGLAFLPLAFLLWRRNFA